ncbi:MAG: heavy metal sensor histidine kinase [Deltaproteobacteria bacterium]|jgi:heavy metal sensor kinase
MKHWWRRRSIRARLTVTYAASLFAILLAYALGIYFFVAHKLEDDLNRDLHGDFEVVESMLILDGDAVRFSGTYHHEPEEEEQIRAEVWDPNGQLLVRTSAVASWAGEIPRSSGRKSLRIGGERVRVLQGPHSVSGRSVLIRVFRSEKHMHATLGTLALIALLGLPLGVAIAAIGGYLVARQSLAPVTRISAQAKIITADRLGERLPIENAHDEIGQLASVFNDTFGRLETSFEQLRRFTAGASHELRTPLTSLRSVGEVALRRQQDAEAYRDVIGSMLEEVERLTRLLDSLLTLSRADGGRIPLDRKAEELLAMVRDVATDMAPLAEEKGQRIEVSGEPGTASVDREVLRLSIVNLLDNAIKHGPEGGLIDVTVSAASDPMTIVVHDEGAGVPIGHRKHIFERFYRVDKARSRATGGSGLGLSIARWAVEAHGGTLVLADDDGGTDATFRIRIPHSEGEGS